jgi:hypothetical protein
MNNSGWQYYNHALIPACAPHETPDVAALDTKELWRNGRPLLARWTTDFDCGYETGWWYCICDRPFDLQSLKSKRRNVIKNAEKYCTVSLCDPIEYEDELRGVYTAVQLTYPAANRQTTDAAAFHAYLEKIKAESGTQFFLCFLRESGMLAGYAIVRDFGSYAGYHVQKVHPDYERYQTNAALARGILAHYADRLHDGFYLCDGARNINHATNFQPYLEKYFGFRKAYCTLHIRYRAGLRPLIAALYPMRGLLQRMDGVKPVHLLNSVLSMEEYQRQGHE